MRDTAQGLLTHFQVYSSHPHRHPRFCASLVYLHGPRIYSSGLHAALHFQASQAVLGLLGLC